LGIADSCAKSWTLIPGRSEALSALFRCQLDDGEVCRDFRRDGRGGFGRMGGGWFGGGGGTGGIRGEIRVVLVGVL